jgi:hypothetical protein
MSTSARLFVDPQPALGPDAKRFMVDCKYGTTRLWWTPGKLELPERHVVSVLLQRHADECGRCRLDRLWAEHGDPALKQATDQMWELIRERQVADHLAGLRN